MQWVLQGGQLQDPCQFQSVFLLIFFKLFSNPFSCALPTLDPLFSGLIGCSLFHVCNASHYLIPSVPRQAPDIVEANGEVPPELVLLQVVPSGQVHIRETFYQRFLRASDVVVSPRVIQLASFTPLELPHIIS